ncbi:LON peptidase substrate-binding domain-containing protein [Panacibacter sp. DH6]|uniref:LON peptidase substrate-binding domain-containing protein n=1 Tax=Panacibacter microcysteis TaxID=2793269 RepID=A0A931E4N3_9BACT|nr:LON peptidase substrate-binding domain-containing protein [Panacibacter microcysteis]MBG9375441.1 LON peptidase substrate-binding domain-containing protein [Panacibacter microcysteis]
MINFIPIFPLSIVVYPGEQLNLHIFEDRYKQLVNECYSLQKPFGIPSVVNNNVTDLGTLVKVKEIVKVYDDGKMDIRTEGLSVFRVLEVIKKVPDKLYSGAIVEYPANEMNLVRAMMQQILTSIRELHKLLKITKDIKKPDDELLSYDVAHHAGLTLEEEYELLGLLREDQRLEYLKRHLNKVIPMINGIELLKEKIQLNGHFRELKGFNFDF